MDLQSLATSALAATIAAVALNRAIEWQKSAARARAQLRGILLELAHAQRCADRFLTNAEPRFADVVYRIVTQYLGSSIEPLAAGGALRQPEAERLHQLYIEADEVNKALDALAVISGTSTAAPRGDLTVLVTMRQMGTATLARKLFESLREDLPAGRAAAEAALARLAWFDPQN